MVRKFVPMCIWRVAMKLEMLGDEVLSSALKDAYATLTKTDDNGHAKCGCGGSGKIHHDLPYRCVDDRGNLVMEYSSHYSWIVCDNDKCKCCVGFSGGLIFKTDDEAWSAWDTAMGLEKL